MIHINKNNKLINVAENRHFLKKSGLLYRLNKSDKLANLRFTIYEFTILGHIYKKPPRICTCLQ